MKKCLFALLLLAGCQPVPTMDMQSTNPAPTKHRVTMERIDVIKDNSAYYGTRSIYVIRDTETGTEFVGISGVGIAEVQRHGKVTSEQ